MQCELLLLCVTNRRIFSKTRVKLLSLTVVAIVISLLAASCNSSNSTGTAGSTSSGSFKNSKTLTLTQINQVIDSTFANGNHDFSITTSGAIGHQQWLYNGIGSIDLGQSTASEVAVSSKDIPYNVSQTPSPSEIPIVASVFTRQEIYWEVWGSLKSQISTLNKSWVSLSIADIVGKLTISPVLLLVGSVIDPFTFIYLSKASLKASLIGTVNFHGNTDYQYQVTIPTTSAENSVPGLYSGIASILGSFIGSKSIDISVSISRSGLLDQIGLQTSSGLHHAQVQFQFNHLSFPVHFSPISEPPANQTIDLTKATNTLAPPAPSPSLGSSPSPSPAGTPGLPAS